jgi:1-acyl-sn-glycerol-3-phosphate acyltransferase
MTRLLQILFFIFIVRPIVLLALGLNVRNRFNLPLKGPAILAANHNSHLDTLVLMSLFPLSKLHRIRPVAAADYFMKNKAIAWFSLNIMGIIPLERHKLRNKEELFQGCNQALENNDILIIFPEGSRGNPEEMGQIKKGIFHLIDKRENIKVVPIVLHGLGRALPRGEALFVPYNCDVIVGKDLKQFENGNDFSIDLSEQFHELFQECITKHY